MLKAMNTAHRALLAVTGGRLGDSFFGMPSVELTTTGRKSGERRSVMLTAPIIENDTVVVVASRGGDPIHPAWYLNLRDDPRVWLARPGEPAREMTARTATPEERAELWPRVVAAYRGYGDYQKRTDREIPLVLLTPREGTEKQAP